MDRKTILVVDDEEIIRRTLCSDLQEDGHEVSTAASGEQAITTLKETHYDMVITDLLMEGLDGIQVLKNAKKIDPEITVIILTGFGDMASAIDALRLGADDYLLKPYDFNEIRFRISRCFEKQDLQKKIKLYEKILPICSVCRKMRDDTGKEHGTGDWMSIERYFAKKTGIKMSHSYCPECAQKFIEEIERKSSQ